MKERLDNFIIENRDNILDDIAKLVNIESFCGDREHTAKALDHVLDRAREMGMKTMKSSKNDAVSYTHLGHHHVVECHASLTLALHGT